DGQSQHTLAELDALTESLVGAGKRSDEFQAAMKLVSSQLDAAKVAATAANAALAEGQDHYQQLEREALRASKALEKANAKNVVPIELKEQADRANAALKAYEVTLRGLEGNSANASEAQRKLEQQLKNVDKIGKHVDDRLALQAQQYEKVASAAGLLPGPLGAYIARAASARKASIELVQVFGAARARMLLFAAGAVIATAAVAAVTAVVIAGAAA